MSTSPTPYPGRSEMPDWEALQRRIDGEMALPGSPAYPGPRRSRDSSRLSSRHTWLMSGKRPSSARSRSRSVESTEPDIWCISRERRGPDTRVDAVKEGRPISPLRLGSLTVLDISADRAQIEWIGNKPAGTLISGSHSLLYLGEANDQLVF